MNRAERAALIFAGLLMCLTLAIDGAVFLGCGSLPAADARHVSIGIAYDAELVACEELGRKAGHRKVATDCADAVDARFGLPPRSFDAGQDAADGAK